jgi:hypothetical protein
VSGPGLANVFEYIFAHPEHMLFTVAELTAVARAIPEYELTCDMT